MTLPPQIRALMRNRVTWERYVGQDGHADEKYAAPVELKCWLESKTSTGDVKRKPGTGLTTFDPEVDIYLDGDDVDAQAITMRDRFSFSLNGLAFKTQPDQITTMSGPDSSTWCVVVSL